LCVCVAGQEEPVVRTVNTVVALTVKAMEPEAAPEPVKPRSLLMDTPVAPPVADQLRVTEVPAPTGLEDDELGELHTLKESAVLTVTVLESVPAV
jgi:hypothetical protein